MNILKIIQFIGDKNPKYEWDNLELPIKPVKGKGYVDDNGRQGEWESYWDIGQLKEKGTYINDKKDGYWEEYYRGDKIRSKGTYKNDKRDGYWEDYLNGKLRSKSNWKDGELISIKSGKRID